MYLYAFTSIFIVSLISFMGLFTFSLDINKLKKITIYMVSLSAGTLLGGALLHLLPEALEKSDNQDAVWFSLLGGILLFFFLEKIICWRHCHVLTSDDHPHPLGIMNLVGDGIHNFLDGIIIASAYILNIGVGIATTIAVITHEIPQEIGDFGVLIHAGYSRRKALWLNFLIALTAVLGAALVFLLGSYTEKISQFIIPLAAGGFIYIATADLIPELKKDISPRNSIVQFIIILIGILIMMGLRLLDS